jgi:hypothetical protein
LKAWAILFAFASLVATVGLVFFKREISGIAGLLLMIPSLIISRIHSITFDDYFVYVKKWKLLEVYPISDIMSINEGDFWSFDPFFQLEIKGKRDETIKIDFAPRSFDGFAFIVGKEYRGELLRLKNRMEALRG